MWSLVFFVYLIGGAVSTTHIDNFISKKLCEQAASKAIVHAKKLDTDNRINVEYACLLEIN